MRRGDLKVTFVIATRNKKKAEEIQRILEGLPVKLLTMLDYPDCPEVEEDADTFAGNAAKKAVEVAQYTAIPAIADDSGLEAYALGNAPGVYSARYAGADADDSRNLDKLLTGMKDVKEGRRGARFVCCIALAFPEGMVEVFEGHVEGSIGTHSKGCNGFGYDPVFYPEGHTQTLAEMSAEEKDDLSHRGMALKKLREYLVSYLTHISGLF